MKGSTAKWQPEDESTRCAQRVQKIYEMLQERGSLPNDIKAYQCRNWDTQSFKNNCETFKSYQISKLINRINAKLRFEWKLFKNENCQQYSAQVSEKTERILENLNLSN